MKNYDECSSLCNICNNLNLDIQNNSHLSFSWRLIKKYKYFIAASSLGQIVDGYSILWPVKHINCLQHLSCEEILELKICVDELITSINKAYNMPVVIFEHGLVTGSLEVGCGVNHAHLHVAPFLVKDVFYEKMNSYLKLESGYVSIFDFYSSDNKINNDYVLISNNNEDCLIYSYNGKRTSQVIRKIIAELSGNLEKWDWKDDFNYLKVKNTAEKISHFYL